jgi:hypothetical protein
MHAREIIERFGGQSALATLLGKGQSTVSYWAKTGIIPARWQPKLLSLASEHGISLAPDDFMGPRVKPIAATPSETFPVALQATSEDETGGGSSPFLFYESEDRAIKVRVMLTNETVWASQRGMSEIFDVDVSTINQHLKNIYDSRELESKSTIGHFPIVQKEGDRLVRRENIEFYNLDVIISVGYRVNSYQATQFRRWATTVIKSYLIKGFALDDERLKQGKELFGKDYFDELLERIREIRSSERRFYQKITDIFSQCSIDYDKNSPICHQFYAHVQDKLHYAIHGHTSAELIRLRADANKPHMGLQSWKNEAKKGKITKLDVTVGKNYLTQEELDNLNRLVAMYLDWAENFARRRVALTMKEWAQKLDGFLEFNAYDVLDGYGKVKRETATHSALLQYDRFRVIQDAEFKSDFDEVVDEIKTKKRLPKSITTI